MPTFLSHPSGLLKISAEASVLILLVLAIQRLCGRYLQPRWRSALWLLVLLRLALPWTFPSPASIFNFFKFPAATQQNPALAAPATPASDTTISLVSNANAGGNVSVSITGHWIAWLWAAGALCLAGCAVVNHYKIHRLVLRRRPLTDATTLNLLEDCKAIMGITTPVTLIEMESIESPTLFGFVRPRLLLPAGLVSSFTRDELRHVFLHELAHIKRRDVLAAWFALVLQAIHWFNPLVWLAFHRLRADRELACDALALSYAKPGENESYGLTIVKLLEGFGRSVWAPSLAGILEDKKQTKERIRMIAKYHKTDRGLALALSLFAGLTLVTLTDAQSSDRAGADGASRPLQLARNSAVAQSNSSDKSPAAESAPPKVIATSPAVGATDVDPSLTEITVTFDQDMSDGMSWTGGGPDFPSVPQDQKARWKDKRTCVLPVKLEAAHFYRVGINSSSYQNFKSVRHDPTPPSAIFFTTRGADEQLKARALAPTVVRCQPANGAQDVSPTVKELRVSFSIPMGGGCSWCTTGNGDSDFPKGAPGKHYYWTRDKKTCVLPVALTPGRTYRLSLNATGFNNFQSDAGVPLEPVSYTFKTSGSP